MEYFKLHPWPKQISEALKVQERFCDLVRTKGKLKKIKTVAGVDVAYSDNNLCAVVVLMEYPSLKVKEIVAVKDRSTFPYFSGFLAFREGPCILKAFKKLKHKPDVVIFDGHGIAHPRRFGLASHLGLLLAVPAIGCAKEIFIGEYNKLSDNKGKYSPIFYKKRIVGAVLRSQAGIKPIFVSAGHKIDLTQSINIVLGCVTKHRIPEPVRLAAIYADGIIIKMAKAKKI